MSDHIFPYWDDLTNKQKNEKNNKDDKRVKKTKVLKMGADTHGETNFNDIPLEEWNKIYNKGKKKTNFVKKSRVSDLFAQFEKLSQVEKINFINLLKNYG